MILVKHAERSCCILKISWKILRIAACIRRGNSRYVHFDNSFNLPPDDILDDLKSLKFFNVLGNCVAKETLNRNIFLWKLASCKKDGGGIGLESFLYKLMVDLYMKPATGILSTDRNYVYIFFISPGTASPPLFFAITCFLQSLWRTTNYVDCIFLSCHVRVSEWIHTL